MLHVCPNLQHKKNDKKFCLDILTKLQLFYQTVNNTFLVSPVLKVDAHGAHVRRTKESWEDQKAG